MFTSSGATATCSIARGLGAAKEFGLLARREPRRRDRRLGDRRNSHWFDIRLLDIRLLGIIVFVHAAAAQREQADQQDSERGEAAADPRPSRNGTGSRRLTRTSYPHGTGAAGGAVTGAAGAGAAATARLGQRAAARAQRLLPVRRVRQRAQARDGQPASGLRSAQGRNARPPAAPAGQRARPPASRLPASSGTVRTTGGGAHGRRLRRRHDDGGRGRRFLRKSGGCDERGGAQ